MQLVAKSSKYIFRRGAGCELVVEHGCIKCAQFTGFFRMSRQVRCIINQLIRFRVARIALADADKRLTIEDYSPADYRQRQHPVPRQGELGRDTAEYSWRVKDNFASCQYLYVFGLFERGIIIIHIFIRQCAVTRKAHQRVHSRQIGEFLHNSEAVIHCSFMAWPAPKTGSKKNIDIFGCVTIRDNLL